MRKNTGAPGAFQFPLFSELDRATAPIPAPLAKALGSFLRRREVIIASSSGHLGLFLSPLRCLLLPTLDPSLEDSVRRFFVENRGLFGLDPSTSALSVDVGRFVPLSVDGSYGVTCCRVTQFLRGIRVEGSPSSLVVDTAGNVLFLYNGTIPMADAAIFELLDRYAPNAHPQPNMLRSGDELVYLPAGIRGISGTPGMAFRRQTRLRQTLTGIQWPHLDLQKPSFPPAVAYFPVSEDGRGWMRLPLVTSWMELCVLDVDGNPAFALDDPNGYGIGGNPECIQIPPGYQFVFTENGEPLQHDRFPAYSRNLLFMWYRLFADNVPFLLHPEFKFVDYANVPYPLQLIVDVKELSLDGSQFELQNGAWYIPGHVACVTKECVETSVVAHEVGHGLTHMLPPEQDLQIGPYANDQSASIDEGVADIIGALVCQYNLLENSSSSVWNQFGFDISALGPPSQWNKHQGLFPLTLDECWKHGLHTRGIEFGEDDIPILYPTTVRNLANPRDSLKKNHISLYKYPPPGSWNDYAVLPKGGDEVHFNSTIIGRVGHILAAGGEDHPLNFSDIVAGVPTARIGLEKLVRLLYSLFEPSSFGMLLPGGPTFDAFKVVGSLVAGLHAFAYGELKTAWQQLYQNAMDYYQQQGTPMPMAEVQEWSAAINSLEAGELIGNRVYTALDAVGIWTPFWMPFIPCDGQMSTALCRSVPTKSNPETRMREFLFCKTGAWSIGQTKGNIVYTSLDEMQGWRPQAVALPLHSDLTPIAVDGEGHDRIAVYQTHVLDSSEAQMVYSVMNGAEAWLDNAGLFHPLSVAPPAEFVIPTPIRSGVRPWVTRVSHNENYVFFADVVDGNLSYRVADTSNSPAAPIRCGHTAATATPIRVDRCIHALTHGDRVWVLFIEACPHDHAPSCEPFIKFTSIEKSACPSGLWAPIQSFEFDPVTGEVRWPDDVPIVSTEGDFYAFEWHDRCYLIYEAHNYAVAGGGALDFPTEGDEEPNEDSDIESTVVSRGFCMVSWEGDGERITDVSRSVPQNTTIVESHPSPLVEDLSMELRASVGCIGGFPPGKPEEGELHFFFSKEVKGHQAWPAPWEHWPKGFVRFRARRGK